MWYQGKLQSAIAVECLNELYVISRSSFRSSPQVAICKTMAEAKLNKWLQPLTASINHPASGIGAEEEEIKSRETNSNFLAQMFYQQNQKEAGQCCLLFLVCAACDTELQENSSPSKMYLVNPLCIFISRRKRGLLCMQVLNGISLLQVSVSPLLSGRAAGAQQHTALKSCHGFQLTSASRFPDRYFTMVVCSASPHPQHSTINHCPLKHTYMEETWLLGMVKWVTLSGGLWLWIQFFMFNL